MSTVVALLGLIVGFGTVAAAVGLGQGLDPDGVRRGPGPLVALGWAALVSAVLLAALASYPADLTATDSPDCSPPSCASPAVHPTRLHRASPELASPELASPELGQNLNQAGSGPMVPVGAGMLGPRLADPRWTEVGPTGAPGQLEYGLVPRLLTGG
jgi:hypothetical protein